MTLPQNIKAKTTKKGGDGGTQKEEVGPFEILQEYLSSNQFCA